MTNSVRPLLSISCLTVWLFWSFAAMSAGQEQMFEVSAGDRDYTAVPVIVELTGELANAQALELAEAESGDPVPVQRVPGESRAAWIVRDLNAGQSRTYRLAARAAQAADEPRVTCCDDGEQLTINVDGAPVLTYHQATVPAPEELDPVFAKSGYIHPLRTPSGQLVTDDFPPDHPHQHGFFFAWVNTTFQGRRVDFWNQARRQGSVEHLETLQTVSGPVFGQFQVLLRHSDLTAPNGPAPVLEESWTLRVYAIESPFLFDLRSEQRLVADSPLTVNEYHYGGMGVRGARSWFRHPENDFLTNLGKTREDGNHSRAHWVISHGPGDEGPAAVISMGHPENLRAPQPVRLHPVIPYFCFAPMVLGPFEIGADEPFFSRYRFATHDGPPDAELAETLWQDYVQPPAVHAVQP